MSASASKVALADEIYQPSDDRNTSKKHDARLPHHDQPTFPPPVGVSKDHLRSLGIGHQYAGVGSGAQVQEQDDAEPVFEGNA